MQRLNSSTERAFTSSSLVAVSILMNGTIESCAFMDRKRVTMFSDVDADFVSNASSSPQLKLPSKKRANMLSMLDLSEA